MPGPLAWRLAPARSIARREGLRLFLVGGAVRDLLLGLPVVDIDLAVEGDAVALARAVGQSLGAPVRVHGRFGTATVGVGPGERLDFAATRRETYERPGALPRVEPARIEEDLPRRDFTVNAMALEIAPGRQARLWDPLDGRRDLARRRLRMLHSRSFEDDPTRAYRAARYANRLHFSVEPLTRRAAIAAVGSGAFDAISGNRRRRELTLLFSEPNRAGAVRWLARLGLIATFHPSLDASPATLSRLRAAERLAASINLHTIYILYALTWAADLRGPEAGALARRLALSVREEEMFRRWPETLARLARRRSPTRSSELATLHLSNEEILAAAACSHRGKIRDRLTQSLLAAPIALAIRGADLVRAGIAPGPAIGRALAKTLVARRDGKISREQELTFAWKAARREFP